MSSISRNRSDDGLSATHEDLVDINGDGLPDKVSQNGSQSDLVVRLNLGYSFSAPINWGQTGGWAASKPELGPGVAADIQNFISNAIGAAPGSDAVRTNVVRLPDRSDGRRSA